MSIYQNLTAYIFKLCLVLISTKSTHYSNKCQLWLFWLTVEIKMIVFVLVNIYKYINSIMSFPLRENAKPNIV